VYTKSAYFYDALYGFKDYKAASEGIVQMVRRHCPRAKSLLDVACSTGRHLHHLSSEFDVEGLDINPKLLAVARERLGDAPLHQGDMMDFDLGRTFDVVTCLFSSIAYAQTLRNFNASIACMARHLAPSGLLLIEPWLSPKQYWRENIVLNVAQAPTQKIAWMYVGKEDQGVVTNEIHFMVGAPDGVETFSEVHKMGLFDDDDYRRAFAGLDLALVHADSTGFFGNGLYVARRQSADRESA
jgi:SAM-dependent methyltransferase